MMAKEKVSTSRVLHAQIKVTAEEDAALVTLAGSRNAGLRLLLDRHMGGGRRTRLVADTTTPETVTHTSAPPSQGSVSHRHRRGEVLRTEMDKGAEVTVYRCAGCEKELR